MRLFNKAYGYFIAILCFLVSRFFLMLSDNEGTLLSTALNVVGGIGIGWCTAKKAINMKAI